MAEPIDMDYVKEHLSEYIEFQIRQGYEIEDIRDLLLGYGYKKDNLDKIFQSIDISQVAPQKRKPDAIDIKKMDRKMYVYLHDMLIQFVKKELEQGYTTKAIKKALINYGHHEEMIDSAIASAGNLCGIGSVANTEEKMQKIVEPVHRKHNTGFSPSFTYGFGFLLIIGFVFFLAIQTEADLLIVLLSFFPTILSLTVVYVVISQLRNRNAANLMAFVGVALSVLIYIAMLQLKSPVQKLSDPNIILILNIILTFILSSVIVIFSRLPKLGSAVPDDDKIPIEYHRKSIDERLEMSLESGANKIKNGMHKLDDIIGNKENNNLDNPKNPSKRRSPKKNDKRRRRLKIKPF